MTDNHTHEVLFDGERVHTNINKTACNDFATGWRRGLRMNDQPYVGRVVVRRLKQDASVIVVNGQEFTLSATETRGGRVQKEIYFANDRSFVKVEIEYAYTEKGYK